MKQHHPVILQAAWNEWKSYFGKMVMNFCMTLIKNSTTKRRVFMKEWAWLWVGLMWEAANQIGLTAGKRLCHVERGAAGSSSLISTLAHPHTHLKLEVSACWWSCWAGSAPLLWPLSAGGSCLRPSWRRRSCTDRSSVAESPSMETSCWCTTTDSLKTGPCFTPGIGYRKENTI